MPNAVAPPADAEARAELTTFQCREAYVYKIPPASTIGHRAELWNVDAWLQEVSAAVVTSGDDCWVRLFDKASGELFAECPLPQDKPLVTVVEPVVDSSRYFVMRIVDRASQRHAFIGMGFRERNQASDFNAALDDHLQYLRRKKEAARMKAEYAAAAAADKNGSGGGGSDSGGNLSGPSWDLALKPGETIKVALPSRASDGSATTPPTQRLGSMAFKAQFNLFSSPTPLKMSGGGAGARGKPGSSSDGASPSALLPPPPPPPRFTSPSSAQQIQQQPSDAAATAAEGDASAAAADPLPAQSPMAVSPKHSAAEEGPGGAAGSSQDGFHARFDTAEGGDADGRGRVAEALGPRSMRVSICIDDDGASDAASLANLSMKAHTSGGSSLAGSVTYSDGGNSEAAADEEAEAHRAAHAAACDAAVSDTAGNAAAAAQAPKEDAGAANVPTSAEVQQAVAHGRKEEGQTAGSKDEWGDFVS